jgi:molecular chaperone DnaK
MGNYIGIDLGTTYSAVAVLDDTGRPAIVHNTFGENITPSCVLIENGKIEIGETARRELLINPKNVAARFKRDMGSEKKYYANNQALSPTELSALVLKKLKQDTEAAIGPIAEAVVTIPANFSNEAREATLNAAQQAGLSVNFIINEPTAAALYYAWKIGQELDGTYAVYDLGGGTFDVSIIKVLGQDINVLSSHGVSRLGGDDFDAELEKIVRRKFRDITSNALNDADFSKSAAEEAKKTLSRRDYVNVRVAQQTIRVERVEYEEAISSLIAQSEMLCESAIEEAGINVGDIKGVFLAGGSTRVPMVRKSVERIFQREPISTVNVDEVVALGAALYAAYKSDKQQLSTNQKAAISSIKFSEVTNFCFGTLMRAENSARGTEELQNSVIINKNEKIPCAVTESFFTISDGQEVVQCRVTQSVAPEKDPRFVKIIWSGELELPPGRPKGQEIQITYGFDENNLMTCSFKDVATGRDIKVNLSSQNDIKKNSGIEKFMVE